MRSEKLQESGTRMVELQPDRRVARATSEIPSIFCARSRKRGILDIQLFPYELPVAQTDELQSQRHRETDRNLDTFLPTHIATGTSSRSLTLHFFRCSSSSASVSPTRRSSGHFRVARRLIALWLCLGVSAPLRTSRYLEFELVPHQVTARYQNVQATVDCART